MKRKKEHWIQLGWNKDQSFLGGNSVFYFDVCSSANVIRASIWQWHNRRVIHFIFSGWKEQHWQDPTLKAASAETYVTGSNWRKTSLLYLLGHLNPSVSWISQLVSAGLLTLGPAACQCALWVAAFRETYEVFWPFLHHLDQVKKKSIRC